MKVDIPDYIPAGMRLAEGWRLLRDGLCAALELPDDELREVMRECLEVHAEDDPQHLQVVGDVLRAALELPDCDMRHALQVLADSFGDYAADTGAEMGTP